MYTRGVISHLEWYIMAIIKISDRGKGLSIVGDDGVVYGTSVPYLLKFLSTGKKNSFFELHRYVNPSPPGKWRKSPVFVNGEKIPYEEYYKDGPKEQLGTPDLMAPKARAEKRKKESFKVNDNVW